jgi:uncharacterized membrane protein YczE
MSKYLIYILGCILFSFGATLFITSNLGTDPLDVLAIGMRDTFGWMIGTTQSVFALSCLVLYSFLNKWKFPPISTFLTFFICGYLIDFFLFLLDHKHIFSPFLEMIFGVIICTQASALIMMSGFGIRAMDLVAISLSEITKKPFWLFKGIAEILLLTVGYFLGGIVGIGTIFFLLFVGWLIQPCIRLNTKLGIPNYGRVH